MKPGLENSALGKETVYTSQYQPDLLFPILRQHNRDAIGITDQLPFHGLDIWTAYEISWLNAAGKPIVAIGDFHLSCTTPNLIESKSFKLYLNSFNNTKIESVEKITAMLTKDLSTAAGGMVDVQLHALKDMPTVINAQFHGICLDDLNVSCDTYTTQPDYLTTGSQNIVGEVLFSDLLRSNCPITGQPDWGSVQISYTGKQIDRVGLLKYIVSLRNHDEFHEQCVERIFMDIMKRCAPEKLMVYARYTRRGGLDINPWRANYPVTVPSQLRLCRQ